MKKFLIAISAIAYLGIIPGYAEIIETTATGTGSSEYRATIDALDNAVRQTTQVKIANIGDTDLSETHIVVKDDTEIRESAKTSVNAKQKSKGWSRVKSWFSSKDSEEESASFDGDYKYSYEKKGGDQEYHDTSIQRQLDMRYSGAVESYEVVDRKESKGKYTVKIKAKIKKLDEYKSPDVIAKAKYTVAVVPADEGKKFQCVGQKTTGKSIEDAAITKVINKLTASKKLTVVDRDNLSKQLKELNLLEKDIANPDNANKLKQVKIADYLLIIKTEEFNASTTTKTIELTGEKKSSTSGNLEMSWRLIETATMEIVASGSESESFSQTSATSCKTVMNSLTKKISPEIADEIVNSIK